MTTALLTSAFFGPVQWYQKLCRYDRVLIDVHESFIKQSIRNRCVIATAQGLQALTVPVVHQPGATMSQVRISDHGNWRHQHWQAITSAYGDSPFLEYYADDLRPFFTERWELLADYNAAIQRVVCQLLDVHPHVGPTTRYVARPADGMADFRDVISLKHPQPDADFTPRAYYQVFSARHGFLPNLSILDLLLNMGPEAIFHLLPKDNKNSITS